MKLELGGKNGGHVIISDEDYDDLSQYKWHMDKLGYVYGRPNKNNKKMCMHRYIMNAPENLIVDHINGIRHDNRRSNLRLSTPVQNSRNRVKKEGTTSKYIGVSYHPLSKKYRAVLISNKKRYYMGCYDDETKAAEIIDIFMIHNLDDDYVKLNFPEKREEYLKKKYVPFVPKKSFYSGVAKNGNNYNALITISKKTKYIGKSKSITKAAKMWDKYVVNNNIPGRKLNFPNDYPNYNSLTIKTFYETIDDNTIKLVNNRLENKTVLIDKQDYNKIKYYKWVINRDYVFGYVNGKNIRLHRYLLNENDSKIFIDHIDNNKLNNTRKNLRLSNAALNAQNKKKKMNTDSTYIGVSRGHHQWVSSITFNGKCTYLGQYNNQFHAARKRDLYILNNYPNQQFKLNFEWNDIDIIVWKEIFNNSTETQTKKIHGLRNNMIRTLSKNNWKELDKINIILSNEIKQYNPFISKEP